MNRVSIESYVQVSSKHPFSKEIFGFKGQRIDYSYDEDYKYNFKKIDEVNELDEYQEMDDFIPGAVIFMIDGNVVIGWKFTEELTDYWEFLYKYVHETKLEKEFVHHYAGSSRELRFVPNRGNVDIFFDKKLLGSVNRLELFSEINRETEKFIYFFWRVRPHLKNKFKSLHKTLEWVQEDKSIKLT